MPAQCLQPRREPDENDAQIRRHGQQHLAQHLFLGRRIHRNLACAAGDRSKPQQRTGALDQATDFRAEGSAHRISLPRGFARRCRNQHRRSARRRIGMHCREHPSRSSRVRQQRLAGRRDAVAHLRLEPVDRAAQQRRILANHPGSESIELIVSQCN